MVLHNRVQDLLFIFLNWSSHFLYQVWPYILLYLVNRSFSHFFNIEGGRFYPFRPNSPQEVNILLLCQDMSYRAQMDLLLGNEGASMNSWVSIIGNIKYKFFYIGGPRIARRVWRDYGMMDAVVYIVNADAIIRGHAELRAGEDLIDLSYDEAFVEVPFLIFGLRFLEGFLNPRERRERLRYFLPRGFLG